MARGWESKAVADQMEEAENDALRNSARGELSPAERARHERLETLKLSRARTLELLERATREAHRTMLQRTLRALEAEMDEIETADEHR